ncbi:MAG: DUF3387 domain-containing protein [Anaerolineales bacterium]|nr:DUF3387 domain-containing protein [Anaerolineales bacterium]
MLSEQFLTEVALIPNKDLGVELLRRLINDEIRARRRTSLVQARRFSDMLSGAIERYNEQAASAVEILNELIEMAKGFEAATKRGEELGLSDDELAFYDALAVNDSAVQVLGDEKLTLLAQKLVQKVRSNISIDWELRESARARMRVEVKKLLRRYGYPPDKQKLATETIVKQAEAFSREWN